MPVGVSTLTCAYYERIGLVPETRSHRVGIQRVDGGADVETRMRFIVRCKGGLRIDAGAKGG